MCEGCSEINIDVNFTLINHRYTTACARGSLIVRWSDSLQQPCLAPSWRRARRPRACCWCGGFHIVVDHHQKLVALERTLKAGASNCLKRPCWPINFCSAVTEVLEDQVFSKLRRPFGLNHNKACRPRAPRPPSQASQTHSANNTHWAYYGTCFPIDSSFGLGLW